jgi:carboxylate-amine ligase
VVDPAGGRAVPLAGAVVRAAAGLDPDVTTELVEPELQQQQVEIATPPRTDLGDLAADLRRLRRHADAAAREVGARVAALATSPLPVRPLLTSTPRYERLEKHFGITCAEQLTCGCHVHVGVASPEEGVAVLDRLRPWLPVLTALTTSSPFWNGADTGYAGYRTQAWNRFPGTGPTDRFGTVAGYVEAVRRMIATGTVLDEAMVYFDARLSHRYPTVEVRVADVCLDADDAVLYGALCRALVDTSASRWRAGEPAPDDPTPLLRLAAWRASRSGTDGDLVHPQEHVPRPAASVVEALLDHVRPALVASGDLRLVEQGLDRVLTRGTGARLQHQAEQARGRLADVVADATERTIT